MLFGPSRKPKYPSLGRPLLVAILNLAFTLIGPSTQAAEPSAYDISPDVIFGRKAGLAMTYDVIRPKQNRNGAAVMFMMSGGWVSGWVAPEGFVGDSVPDGFRHFRELVDKGYALVIVRHGSSPVFKVPDAVADVRVALRHLKANSEKFGIDPKRIGVCGASAGGHLSLMLGTAPREIKPEQASSEDDQVAAVVAYFPPVDLRKLVGPSDSFPALDFDPDKAPEVSPLLYVTSDDPPTLLIHGDKDRLVSLSNSQTIHEAMREKQVQSELIVIEGASHGFTGDGARRASTALIDWFDKHLDVQDKSEASIDE
jgi:acetyl esterase/lipase